MSAEEIAHAARERLQGAIGYRFVDVSLLLRALTHRSFGPDNNERLEFLGDALLNFTVAAEIYRLRPKAPEGDLSRLRASVVREETLAAAARRVPLSEAMRFGPGELRTGGFRRDAPLADGLEALVGGVYFDGGIEAARPLILRLLAPELASLPEVGSLKDYKTRLQEALQADARPLPEYTVLREEGPSHRRSFTVRCQLADEPRATEAEAHSRRIAEQRAASLMLDAITSREKKHA